MNETDPMPVNIVYRAVRLSGTLFQEEGRYIARCLELHISDHGDTEEEAEENLVKTLMLFFESCLRRGTIEEVLNKMGIPILDIEPGRADTGKIVVPMPHIFMSRSDASKTAG